jgi:hypothetical protein
MNLFGDTVKITSPPNFYRLEGHLMTRKAIFGQNQTRRNPVTALDSVSSRHYHSVVPQSISCSDLCLSPVVVSS